MRHVNNLIKSFLMTSFCFLLGSCANDDDVIELNEEQNTIHTVKMQFIGSVVGFDQQSNSTQTRATTSWADGDKIYITFYNDNTIVPGEATYYSSSGWVVNYDGNLVAGTDLKCEVRYFVNATYSDSYTVSFNANSEIYEDMDATYTYEKELLIVQGTLAPKTGRIRFTGTPNATIYITGISVFTTFSSATNTFSSSDSLVTATVALNGSTPYIYGEFADTDRNIGLVGSNFAYTRTCTSDMLKAGESGYMAIPSENSHYNWRDGLYVKVNGVEFKMIPVTGYSGGFYLIGETEVTEALFYAANGSFSSQSSSPSSTCPETTSRGWANICIEKMNNITGMSFALPTVDQWLFAAKGGVKSQDYIYCGSNIPEDVAWYSANTPTKQPQPIKTKAPNELGIYDMSGNVEEMTSTDLDYPFYYTCGGSYASDLSEITKTACSERYRKDSYAMVGFRLVLTFP